MIKKKYTNHLLIITLFGEMPCEFTKAEYDAFYA